MNMKLVLGLALCASILGAGAAFADDAMPAKDTAPMADTMAMKPKMMHHHHHHHHHHMMHPKAMMKGDKMMAPDAPK